MGRIWVLACVCLLVWTTQAIAENIVVVTEEWPPYTCSENSKVQGVVTEIVKATLDRADLSYSIDVYPWARSYEMALKQKNVLIYSIFKLPNRAHKFKWIKIEGLSVNMSLFRPKYREDVIVHSLEDAKKYRIGVTRETSTHHFLLSQGFSEGANLFPVNTEEQNALKSEPSVERIDLTTGDELSLAQWLKTSDLPSDYWTPVLPLFKEDIYMAFGLSTPDETVESVRRAFMSVREDGTLDAIVAKYQRMFE